MGQDAGNAAPSDLDVRQGIVQLAEGRRAVVAGPGSGKTRLLVDRLLWLLEGGTAPREILTLVFNRKAAGELRQRLAEALPDRGFTELRIATFHSFALSLVDRFWGPGGFPSRPTLLPSDEQRALVHRLLAEADDGWGVTDEVRTSGSFARAVADAVLRAQEQLRSPEELAARDPAAGAFLRRYRTELTRQAKVDYAGVLAQAARLAAEPAVRDALGVRHLLVDEYQDANHAQEALIRSLVADTLSLVVVGDVFQAIYAFRGASPRLLEEAGDRLGADRVALTDGYRCPQPVIDASSALARADPRLPERGPLTGTDAPGGVAAAAFAHRTDELDWVAEHVRRLGTDTLWDRIAVLCRSLRTLRAPLQAALARAGLPFRIVGGGRSATHHPWVGPLLGLLELANESHEADAVGYLEAAALSPLVGGEPLELREAFRRARFRTNPQAALRGWAEDHDNEQLRTLLAAVRAARGAARRGADPATVAWLLWSRLPVHARLGEGARDMESLPPHEIDGARAVGAWMDSLVRFVDRNPDGRLDDYLATLERAEPDADTWLADRDDAAPAVQVMTVHQAKGLTFDHVLVPLLEEDQFPAPPRGHGILDRIGLRTDEGAEERRLLYVALTRARTTATLTCTTGTEEKMGAAPSRFLIDLRDHLCAPDELFGSPDTDPIRGVATVTQARRSWGRVLRDPGAPAPRRAVAAAGLGALGADLPWIGRDALEPVRPLRERPWTLSATAIDAYFSCGRKFLFDRVLALAPFEPGPNATFGTAVHAGIQRWIDEGAGGRDRLLAHLESAFDEHADEDAVPIRAQRESFRRRLPNIAELLADNWWVGIGEPLHTEYDATVTREDGVRLRAKIDLICRTPEGLEIVDWKTGRLDRKNDPDNIQLKVYYHIVRERFGEPVARLRLASFRDGLGEQPVEPDHDEQCRRLIEDTLAGLRAERFEVGENPPCRYCPYKAICDVHLRGQEPPW